MSINKVAATDLIRAAIRGLNLLEGVSPPFLVGRIWETLAFLTHRFRNKPMSL